MAKFCGKCGSPIVDGASFCNVCGAPIQQGPVQPEQTSRQVFPGAEPGQQTYAPQAQYIPQSSYGYTPEAAPSAPAKKSSAGLVIVFVALVLVAIAAIVAFILVIAPEDTKNQSQNESVIATEYGDESFAEDTWDTNPGVPYKKAMEHFCGGMAGNADDVIACYPEEVIDILRTNNGMTTAEFNEWAQEYADTIRLSIEENVGGNCKVDFLVLKERKVSSAKLKKIQNQLTRSGMDVSVSEAYDLVAEVTLSGDTGEKTEEKELTALKIYGVWYITLCTENGSQISVTFF